MICSDLSATVNLFGAASEMVSVICICIRWTASSASELPKAGWEVTDIAGVDEARQKIYYVSTEASPLERQLYSIKLNGKDRARVSQGAGTHEISMGPTAEYYLDDFSSLNEPPRSTVRSIGGDEWAVFHEAEPQADRRLRDSTA